jgi:hypothetical protein
MLALTYQTLLELEGRDDFARLTPENGRVKVGPDQPGLLIHLEPAVSRRADAKQDWK